uniref:Uncharacterized protein n=1 Tax=viral metagenome TaxID=1070528 RepID=A0A6C0CBV3_9ZZZZ
MFQEWMSTHATVQSLCEIVTVTRQHKYISLVMQKSHDYNIAHIVGLFANDFDEYLKYMTDSEYYEELSLFYSIRTRQHLGNYADKFDELIVANEIKLKPIIKAIEIIENKWVNYDFDFQVIMNRLTEISSSQ